METKKIEVALYKSMKYGFEVLLKSSLADPGEYIPVSKPVMVEFEMLSSDDGVQQEISSLRKEQAAIKSRMQDSIDNLERRINKLREGK